MTQFELGALVAASALCLGCGSSALATSAADARKPDRESVVDIVHYDAALTVGYESWEATDDESVQGVIVTVAGEVMVAGTGERVERVVLDAAHMTIDDVVIVPPASWNLHQNELVIAWEDPFDGEFEARIHYRTMPQRGVSVSEPNEGLVTIWTTFHTWYWMPVDSDPAERATLSLDLSVPEGWDILATGDGPEAPGPDVVRVIPHPAYTYGFVIGHLGESTRDEGLTVWGTTPEVASLVIERTAAARDRFRATFGDHWPAEEYVQAFVYGASPQEYAGMAVLPRSYQDTLVADPDEDWLLVHELAHQVWGNLVTCATWGDFWLNEGVVTWWVARDKALRGDSEGADRELSLWQQRLEKHRPGAEDPRIHRPGVEVEGAGGPLVYSGGALVIEHMNTAVGADAVVAALSEIMNDARASGYALSTVEFLDRFGLDASSRLEVKRLLGIGDSLGRGRE